MMKFRPDMRGVRSSALHPRSSAFPKLFACLVVAASSLNVEAEVTATDAWVRGTVPAQKITGARPEFSTTGGTSDARFIKDHCPVAELGLSNATMHKANECATLADIALLTDIYSEVIASYFANPPR